MRKLLLITAVILAFLMLWGSGAVIADDSVNSTNVTANLSDNVQKDVELLLSRTRFLPNESIDGVVKLKISDPFVEDKVVRVWLANELFVMNLTDLLDDMGISYGVSNPDLELVSGSASKGITIKDSEPKMLGLRLPGGIESVDSVEMDVIGEFTNTLLNPRIDFGNDGIDDWYYLGGFVKWSDNILKSPDLNEVGSDSVTVAAGTSEPTFSCALIDLNRTKDLKIMAKYKTENGGGADMRATIFSPLGSDPSEIAFFEGVGDYCDLNEQATFVYGECDLHLDYATSGKVHVCIYSQGESEAGNLYKLGKDGVGTTSTSYVCQPGLGLCTPSSHLSDYSIKVRTGEYEDNLNKATKFSEWNTYRNSFAKKIEKFIGYEYGECTQTICEMPMTISADGSGDISFSNIEIVLSTSQGQTFTESVLYEIAQPFPEVESINEEDIEDSPVTLEIPLSLFGNLTVDTPDFVFKEQLVKVIFNEVEDNETIRVYKDNLPLSDVEKSIASVSRTIAAALANPDTASMLELLELKSGLEDAQTQLAQYSILLATPGDVSIIESEVETFIQDLPKSIRLKKSLVDSFVSEPNDVKSVESDLPDDELYLYQFLVEVVSSVKVYELEYFNGDVKTVLFITKTVSPDEDLDKANIVEVIPKSVASSVDDIKFKETPTRIINSDPVVSWYFSDFSRSHSISYVVESDADFDIYDFKTLISPSTGKEVEPEEPEEPEFECGDGFCDIGEEFDCPEDCEVESSLPFDPVLIGAGAFGGLLVLLYLISYLGSNFRKVALGGMPFKKGQLVGVENYIKASKARGLPDSRIQAALKQNKWKPKQIKFAYAALKIDQKLDAKIKAIPSKSQGTGALGMYVVAALERGMPLKTVRAGLMRHGWKAGDVSAVYRSARLKLPIKALFSKFGIR